MLNTIDEITNYNLIKDAETIDSFVIEQQKLKAFNALKSEINKVLSINNNLAITDAIEQNNLFLSGLLNFLVASTALETFFTSFIFGLNIITLIPLISQPVILSLTCIFAALDTFIACSFQISFLAQCMGMERNSGALENIDSYSKQLEILNDICTKLQHVNWIKKSEEEYKNILKEFNNLLNDLEKNSKDILNYESSKLLDNAKYMITVFGVASTIASSYFMSRLIIESIASPIGYHIAGPWVSIFIGLIIIANVAFYLLSTHFSLSNIFEPGLDKLSEFKQNYSLFKLNQENLENTNFDFLSPSGS